MVDVSKIEITSSLPTDGVIDSTYHIKGTVKVIEDVGAPPWVYAEIQKKDWYKPDLIEETNHERGFPLPLSGEFDIEWTPRKDGIYEVTIVATPAPLSLPVVGVFPIVGKSERMKITISSEIEAGIKLLSCSFS